MEDMNVSPRQITSLRDQVNLFMGLSPVDTGRSQKRLDRRKRRVGNRLRPNKISPVFDNNHLCFVMTSPWLLVANGSESCDSYLRCQDPENTESACSIIDSDHAPELITKV